MHSFAMLGRSMLLGAASTAASTAAAQVLAGVPPTARARLHVLFGYI